MLSNSNITHENESNHDYCSGTSIPVSFKVVLVKNIPSPLQNLLLILKECRAEALMESWLPHIVSVNTPVGVVIYLHQSSILMGER